MSGASLSSILVMLAGRLDEQGQPLGERREMTRQRIVRSASVQLIEVGYRRMRIDEVASCAEVTRPTLYTYFESKEHVLIAAMAEEALHYLKTSSILLDASQDAKERLRAWVRQAFLYIEQAPLSARLAKDRDPDVMRILLEHELANKALAMNADMDKGRLLSGLVHQAFPKTFSHQEADEIASLIRLLSHMAPTLMDGHAMFGLSLERTADLMSTLLVDGMAAQASASSRRD